MKREEFVAKVKACLAATPMLPPSPEEIRQAISIIESQREALKSIVIWAEGSTCEICGKKKMTETDAYDYASEELSREV